MTRVVLVLLVMGCDPAPRAGAAATVASPVSPSPAIDPSLDGLVSDWLATPPPRRNEALLSRMLRALGARGLDAMLRALATPEYGGAMDGPTRDEMETALVEAAARLDDPRALPVLRARFVDGPSDAVRAAAARGIARSCGDEDLALLVDHAAAGDAIESAAIEGLGRCLRHEAAERLAARLAEAPDADRAAPIAHALGRLAAAAVWSAPSRKNDLEGDEVRLDAARALVGAVARFDCPDARRALAMIRHPATAALAALARRTASPDAAARLDAISE
jgi:hypothetical protein